MGTDLQDVAQLLPDYELGSELGRGAFGIVWSARHRQLDREVAVKQLAGPGAADPEHVSRFRREARILASLDHPHVVRVFDYRESEEQRLLVMELLTGGTLADRRANGLSLETAVAAVMAAACGLHHVHEQGILHRDVKPENLMFDGRGVLKVTDFGIARGDNVNATALQLTRVGAFFGTPAYIAPEQAAVSFGGGWPPVGPAADQYSLAAVLYEILSGQLTHDATGGLVGLCTRRMNEEARPLRDLVPGVPAPLEAAVMRAVARDPTARHLSTEAFGVALGAAMTAAVGSDWYSRSEVQIREPGAVRESIGGPRTEPTAAVRPPGRRRWLVLVGILIVLAVVAGSVLLSTGGGNGSGTAGKGPVGGAPAALPLEITQRWSFSTSGHVFASPARAGDIVVVGSEDGKVYGLDTASGAERWRLATNNLVRSSAAVAGSEAWFGGNDGNLYAVDTTTGAVRWKTSLGYEIVSSPAVAGGAVFVGADGVRAFDAATGTPKWTYATGDVVVSSPAVSGDLVVVGSNDGNVYGIARADGTERWRVGTGAAVQSSPVISGGVAYVGSLDGKLYAIDVATGKPRWATALGSAVKSSPTVTGGRVFVGTDAGRLVALDARERRDEMVVPSLAIDRFLPRRHQRPGGRRQRRRRALCSRRGQRHPAGQVRHRRPRPVLAAGRRRSGDRGQPGQQGARTDRLQRMSEPDFVVDVTASGRIPLRLVIRDRLPVGRAGEGLILDDERCSRTHCELWVEGRALMVEDRASTNGTFVNGARIVAPTALGPGDVIVVGSTTIVVDPDAAPAGAEAPGAASVPAQTAEVLDVLRASVIGGTVTIVFSDIVDSTAIGAGLGDRDWFSLLTRHDEITRGLLVEHSGTEVKHQGDGFMLTFPSARLGVLFAVALQSAFDTERAVNEQFPLHVRVGVHTGEVIHVDGDLFGRHVNLAARVAAQAASDEVLVSRLVHELASSMGDLQFGAPREAVLKGFGETFLLFPAQRV